MANYNAVDMDWLGGEIGECTDILREKINSSADIAFPEEFKSLLNGITPVINGVSPTTITNNGTHSTDNYSQIKVAVTMKYFATDIVANVTAGQALTVTGITDAKTGEVFDVKGVFACIEPTATTNYTSGNGKPSLVVFYNANTELGTVIVAVHNVLYTVRAGCNSTRLTISGNSFSFMADTASMYGVMPSSKWRWVAWG